MASARASLCARIYLLQTDAYDVIAFPPSHWMYPLGIMHAGVLSQHYQTSKATEMQKCHQGNPYL